MQSFYSLFKKKYKHLHEFDEQRYATSSIAYALSFSVLFSFLFYFRFSFLLFVLSYVFFFIKSYHIKLFYLFIN
jgi:hypothetical protein